MAGEGPNGSDGGHACGGRARGPLVANLRAVELSEDDWADALPELSIDASLDALSADALPDASPDASPHAPPDSSTAPTALSERPTHERPVTLIGVHDRLFTLASVRREQAKAAEEAALPTFTPRTNASPRFQHVVPRIECGRPRSPRGLRPSPPLSLTADTDASSTAPPDARGPAQPAGRFAGRAAGSVAVVVAAGSKAVAVAEGAAESETSGRISACTEAEATRTHDRTIEVGAGCGEGPTADAAHNVEVEAGAGGPPPTAAAVASAAAAASSFLKSSSAWI